MATTMDGKGLVVLVLLALTAIFVMGMKYAGNDNPIINVGSFSHAEAKHDTAIEARNCFDRPGAQALYYQKSNNNRGVRLCLTPDKRMAVQVYEYIHGKWEEITAYIRDGEYVYNDMIDYAEADMEPWGRITWKSIEAAR